MKKIIYSLMAATFLFATSCSEDEVLSNNQGNEAEVTFTTNLDGILASRAIADGTTVDQLTFNVYSNGNLLSELTQTVSVTNKTAKVTANLVKGQTYSFTFWAQDKDATCYKLESGVVKVTYGGEANDETRDAFFAVRENLTVKGSINETITLKRPFAQINVGTADTEAAKTAGIEVGASSVTVKSVATSLNLLTGAAEDNTDATFTIAKLPNEKLQKVNGKEYDYLAMNYVLVGAEKELVDAEISLYAGIDATEPINKVNVTSLPVQRNYRTNIVGNILTSQAVFDVVVDEEFEDDYNPADHLAAVLKEGGEFTLLEDLTIEESLVVEEGANVTLNLNGHNIINTSSTGNFGEDEGIIAYGELTIEGNGTVQANSMAVWARGADNHAVINIKGGTFKGLSQELAKDGRGVIYASGNNTINIYGGTFEAMAADMTSYADKTNGVYAALNVQDNSGNINVYGGTFKKFNPAKPGTEPADWNTAHPNGFVAEGYKSVNIGTETEPVYEVCVDINVEEGGAVTLEEDGTIVDKVSVVSGTLNGGGNTLTVSEKPNTNYLIHVTGDSKIIDLNLVGDNQKYVTASGEEKSTRALMFEKIGNISVENVHISGVGYALNVNCSSTNPTHTLIVKNSTLEGWTSYGTAVKEATFTNVHFGIGTYFGENSMFNGGIRPYSTAVFDNCTFDKGFYLSFEELTGEEKITLKNCTVNGTVLTADNWKTYLEAEGESTGKIFFE